MDVAERHGAVVMGRYGHIADDPERPKPDLSDTRDLRIGTLDMQARLSSNMITLCMTDFLDDYPNVTVMSHNLGGNIPFEIERMDHRCLLDTPDEPLPSSRMTKPGLYIDCNSFGAQAIKMGVRLYGADKIMFGTDGTEFGCEWSVKALKEARIDDAARHAILHGNAARFLGHLATLAPYQEAAE